MTTEETGASEQIMKAVHEYGISCVNLHIRNRESGFGGIEDERKHQQAVWCAIRDMIDNEISMLQDACEGHANSVQHWPKSYKRVHHALLLAIRQNEHDILMTGEEIRSCRAAIENHQDDRAIEWAESEESMRGAPLAEVLRDSRATVIWHRTKPKTTNPVWEVIGQ